MEAEAGRMSNIVIFWLINISTALLRLLVIGRIGLGDDEGHYFAFSRQPELSYFDHPPAIGYIIKFFTGIFGVNEFAVRFPAVLFFFVMSIFIYFIAKKLFDEKTALWSIILLNVVPVFSFLGAVLTVPDVPLALLWVIFIYVFILLVRTQKPGYWYILGVLLGAGLLSKYNAILLPASALLFIALSPKHRHWLMKKEPYLALVSAFIIFLPVLLWNMENGWASFGFQLKHGFGSKAPAFSAALLGKCLGAQAGYISPFLFIIYWAALVYFAIKALKAKDENSLLIFSFSFPTLFLFNAIASFNEILPHWPAMGYLVLTPAVAKMTLESWDKKWFRVSSYTAWGFGLFLTLLVPLQAVYKVLPAELFLPAQEARKIEDGITKAEKMDVTNELYGWGDAGRKIAELVENSPEPKPFIFTHRHYIASQLKFYVPGHPKIYCLSDRIDAYDFWQRDLSVLDGRDGIFVCDNRFFTEPEKIYPFSSWDKPVAVESFRKGKKTRIFWLTTGRNFKLSALPKEYTAGALSPWVYWKDYLNKADTKVFFFLNRERKLPLIDYLMRFLSFTGDGILLGIFGGLVLWFYSRENFWKKFLFMVALMLFSGALTHFIKEFFSRARPLTVFGDLVRVLGPGLKYNSFPSGHTQVSFLTATFLSLKVRKFWYIFFAFAALIGISRIYVGVHFPLDVLAGAVLGTTLSYIITKLFKI